MKITRMKLSDLNAAPYNPRRITDEALAGLQASIARWGLVQPVVWNERTAEVVGGHQRIQAMEAHGVTECDCVVVDLPAAEAKALNIALNSPTIQGTFVSDDLDALLASLATELPDLPRELDLDALLSAPRMLDGACDPDEVPEPPEKPITKPGDIWTLGDHRLMCGDSTNADDVALLMNGERAALIVTDPPYGVSIAGGSHDPMDIKNYRSGGTVENDDLTGEKLAEFLSRAFTIASGVLVPGGAWYVWYASAQTRAFLDACELLGGMRHNLVWVKPQFVFSRCDYHYRHEPCLYGWTPGAGHQWLGSRDQSSVFESGRDGDFEKKQHPTVKPCLLYEVPIGNHTKRGDLTYEPFSGSGTALIAAERTGRRCRAMELEPRYCDVAIARWEKFTGKKASRE